MHAIAKQALHDVLLANAYTMMNEENNYATQHLKIFLGTMRGVFLQERFHW